jgi:hypothetical protein
MSIFYSDRTKVIVLIVVAIIGTALFMKSCSCGEYQHKKEVVLDNGTKIIIEWKSKNKDVE